MRKFLIILSFLTFAASTGANVSAREVYSINSQWKFFTFNERDSLTVNLPHSWNSDALTGAKGYYRGIGNYLKYIDIKPAWKGKRLFVKFHGANSVTNFMVNGRHVGQHSGGSNAFVFDITDHVDFEGRNLFWIVVNNAERTDVLPTAGPDNSYGGIFRDLELIVANTNVIGLDTFGSDGVFFRTTKVSDAKAEGSVGVRVNSAAARTVTLEMKIRDRDNKVVAQNTIRPRLEKGISDHSVSFEINSPALWNGTVNPYLYTVTMKLTDGQSVDSVAMNVGIRTFSVNPRTGFHLNGKPYPVKGVVLRRDRATYGPVSLPSQLREDIEIIREMGANAVRVAGGSHNQEFYDLCDEYGLLVVNDLPLNGAISFDRKGFYDTPQFRDNAKMQLREMVYQLYNHPSVISWSLFTEPELRGDNPIPFIKELHTITKAIDPARLTCGTSTRDGDVNKQTDLVIFDHALGWIEGMPEEIAIWSSELHSDPVWNKLNSGISYRCGASIHQQSEELKRPRRTGIWHPENWQTHFHEVYLKTLDDDRQLWGMFVGDIFEFGSVVYTYGEGLGIDDCGLVTFDRQTRKDAFYLYKANWNKADPFVYITGRRNITRSNPQQDIKVYSNQPEVELIVNGRSLGSKRGERGIFTWTNVNMRRSHTSVKAVAGASSDTTAIKIAPGELMSR